MEERGLSEEDRRLAQCGGRTDLVIRVPTLRSFSDEDSVWLVSSKEEEAVRLVVRGLWGGEQYDWRETNRVLTR